jgi:integrase
MGRSAKLRQKKGRWYSEAGGKGRYYGRVGVVPHAEALRRLRAVLTTPTAPTVETLTVKLLVERYLDWCELHRSVQHHRNLRVRLDRWAQRWGEVQAASLTRDHLDTWIDEQQAAGVTVCNASKHETAVRSCVRWGTRQGKCLPAGFRPFEGREKLKEPQRPLLESDLPTKGEVRKLLAWKGPIQDLLAVYHATGARTGELAAAKVRDFQAGTGQIVLVQHKRSATMKQPQPRQILLNGKALAIVRRLVKGRESEDPIFAKPSGRAWTVEDLGHAFAAGRKALGVRDSITIYSFRHLWISEAMMAGLDTLMVAKMAGTSVMMIERVYGHWRTRSLQAGLALLDRKRAG